MSEALRVSGAVSISEPSSSIGEGGSSGTWALLGAAAGAAAVAVGAEAVGAAAPPPPSPSPKVSPLEFPPDPRVVHTSSTSISFSAAALVIAGPHNKGLDFTVAAAVLAIVQAEEVVLPHAAWQRQPRYYCRHRPRRVRETRGRPARGVARRLGRQTPPARRARCGERGTC